MVKESQRLNDWLIILRRDCRVNIYEAERNRNGKKVRPLRQKLAVKSPNEITLKWLYETFGMLYFVLRELDSNNVERRQILLKPDFEFMKSLQGPAPAPMSEIPPELAPTLE